MDIKKELKAFKKEFGIDDADNFPAFSGGIEGSAVLKCNWLGWKKRAELECNENPETIEIDGLKTIHKLCKFADEHNMEGCSFTKIVERMFDELAKAQAVPKINGSIQAHELTISEIKAEIEEGYDLCQDIHLLDALVERGIQIGKILAVPEGFVLVPKEKLMQIIGSVSIIEPITRGNPYMDSIKRELTAITDVVKTVIEAREPAPLKLGDLVEPIDHRYTLASGCERYPYAYVVNTNPFQLMSEEGDMYWCCTVEAGGYKLIKSNNQLPEAVSLRMIREGLLAPVETQEQSHD